MALFCLTAKSQADSDSLSAQFYPGGIADTLPERGDGCRLWYTKPVGHELVSGYVSQARGRTWARGRLDAGAGGGSEGGGPGPGLPGARPARRRRGGGDSALPARRLRGAPVLLGSLFGVSGPGCLGPARRWRPRAG